MSCICPGNDEAPPTASAHFVPQESGHPGAWDPPFIPHWPSLFSSEVAPRLWPCVLLQRSAFQPTEQFLKPFTGRGTSTNAQSPVPPHLRFPLPFPLLLGCIGYSSLDCSCSSFVSEWIKKPVSGNSKKRGYIREIKLISAPSPPGRTVALTCAGCMFGTVCWSSFLSGVLLRRKFSSLGVQKNILEVKSVMDQHDSRVAVKSMCIYWQRRSFHRKS